MAMTTTISIVSMLVVAGYSVVFFGRVQLELYVSVILSCAAMILISWRAGGIRAITIASAAIPWWVVIGSDYFHRPFLMVIPVIHESGAIFHLTVTALCLLSATALSVWKLEFLWPRNKLPYTFAATWAGLIAEGTCQYGPSWMVAFVMELLLLLAWTHAEIADRLRHPEQVTSSAPSQGHT